MTKNGRFKEVINRFKAFNYSMVDQAIVSGSNFLSALLIVRLVGIYEFGVFSTYWIGLLFVNTIFVSTIVSPMMVLVSKVKNLDKYYGSLLIMVLGFMFLFFIISSLLGSLYNLEFLDRTLHPFLGLIYGIYVALYHFQEYFRRYFYSLRNYKSALITDALSHLSRITIFILILFSNNIKIDINSIFIIYSITTLFGLSYGLYKHHSIIEKNLIKSHMLEHLKIAKWLLPSGLMKWSSINLFLATASFILGPLALGVIRLAQNIVSVYNLILLGIENFVPLEAGAIYQSNGQRGLISYLGKIIKIGLLFTLFVSLFLVIFSDYIMTIIYGVEYIQYSFILYWFSVFLFFMFINSIINIYLIVIGQSKLTFIAYALASCFALVIFYPLIVNFEIVGVLSGMLTTYILLTGSALFLIKKSRNEREIS